MNSWSMRFSRSFSRWLFLLWGGLMLLWGLFQWERDSLHLIMLFVLLILLHLGLRLIGLYWLARRYYPLYFFLQGILIGCINLLALPDLNPNASLGVVIGLYLALVGEAVVIMQRMSQVALVAVYSLVLFLLCICLRVGWLHLPFLIELAVPFLLVAGSYASLYLQQTQQRERAQAALQELEKAHT